jgi:hypothetical protein
MQELGKAFSIALGKRDGVAHLLPETFPKQTKLRLLWKRVRDPHEEIGVVRWQ